MDKILLFIPMYNCEKQIVRVLDQLNGETAEYLEEIIIVNNRSTDQGEETVRDYLDSHALGVPVKLLRNRDNYGLGGSHKVAFEYALKKDFDYVIVFHGDDQGEIADLLPVLKKRIYKKYDCCLGARFIYGSKLKGYSLFRTLGNWVYNVLFSIVLGREIYDLGSGLNMYRTEIFRDKYFHKYPDNLTFNCYMLFAAHCYKQSLLFFPITWKEEDQVSNVKMARQAWDTFRMAVGYFFGRSDYLKRDFRQKRVEDYASDAVTQSSPAAER